jgi:hypothetical protein
MLFSYNPEKTANSTEHGGVMRIKGIQIVPLFILVLVLACAGCLGTKVLPVNKTEPPSILVDYHRTGGIAGVNDRLVIFDNGVAAVSGRSTSTEISLNQTDIALISVLFNESQFSQLQANYPAPHESTGLMTYTISYLGKTVTAEDTDVPPSLVMVIEKLNQIIQSAGTQKSAYPTIGLTR